MNDQASTFRPLRGEHLYPATDAVVYGNPAAEVVRDKLAAAGRHRAFVLSGRSLAALPDGPLQRVRQGLGEHCVGSYTGIRAHTPREDVLAAAQAARDAGADMLVAVGGGSVIDAAKAVQLCLWMGLRRPDDFDAFRRDAKTPAKVSAPPDALRTISVSTTLSAAEFTPYAGVTDAATHTKQSYAHRLLVPQFAVLDPQALADTPRPLLYATAIRSVDHAVETYLSPRATPATDMLSLRGLTLLADALRRLNGRPFDAALALQAQFGMWQSIMAAVAGVTTGASHGIGYALGTGFGVGHGETSCVMLPAVLDWTSRSDVHGQAELAAALGRPGQAAGPALRALITELGLPTTLQAVGVQASQHGELAERALAYPQLGWGRRPARTAADVMELLALADAPLEAGAAR